MEIKEIIQLLAQGVNPATGEVFDLSVLGQDDVYAAVKLLKDAAAREHKKLANKGLYSRLCEEFPGHIVLLKLGVFYTAYNKSAEILGQVMGYNVAYLNDSTPVTGGPDLSKIAGGLRAANLSYVAYNSGAIEERFDGNNPFA